VYLLLDWVDPFAPEGGAGGEEMAIIRTLTTVQNRLAAQPNAAEATDSPELRIFV